MRLGWRMESKATGSESVTATVAAREEVHRLFQAKLPKPSEPVRNTIFKVWESRNARMLQTINTVMGTSRLAETTASTRKNAGRRHLPSEASGTGGGPGPWNHGRG